SFFAKANAAVAQGAAGVLIANNVDGTINMNLTDYKGSVPVVSITKADGNLIKSGSESHEFSGSSTASAFTYYTGTITVGNKVGTTNYQSKYYTMSSFSSMGVPESLDLKPEITTPGGDIYAVNGLATASSGTTGGHDQYENMSGTSMASPQFAGIVATMAQFYRESGLEERAAALGFTQRQTLQSLLMSTATPLIEEDSGSYYSVLKQGSGLADLEGAVNSKTLVFMNETTVNGEVRKDISDDAADGKVKAELGDDPERSAMYGIEFTLNNLSDEPMTYDLDAEFFTQDIFAYYTLDENGDRLTNEDGSYVVSTYLDTWTAPLESSLTWYVNGQVFEPYPERLEYDVNYDGHFNEDDAQAILDHIAGPANNEHFDEEKADLDGDGDVTSYDAYLALQLANEEREALPVQAVAPAGGSVTVKVVASVPGLADYDDNGAYVEGYIFAKENASRDGAEGVVHSIPVLGYYGGWGEPRMIDVGSALEYEFGLEQRYPYMTAALGKDALSSQYFVGTHSVLAEDYILGGNPVSEDKEYRSERNAINSKTILAGAAYSQIRNSVGYRYVVYDGEGEAIRDYSQRSNTYSAYYHQNQGKWMNTRTSSGFGYRPTDFEEGETMILGFYLAPEYFQDPETGEIDWSPVYPSMMLAFTVDDTAPSLDAVFGSRNGDKALVTVSAKDAGYISGFFVYDEDGNLIYSQGARTDAKASEAFPDRQDYIVEVDGSTVSNHLEVEVWDYAANVTTARINLDKEELNDPLEVRLSDSAFSSVVGNSYKLSAVVYPWGFDDQRVTWTSSDESIAVVDENGIVTGVAEGTATITATSVADPESSADCEATFVVIDRDLRGLVWDENGEVWFSSFNTSTLPAYTKLTDEKVNLELATTAYAKNGNFYAATFDSSELLSDLYIVDDETFETTYVGGSAEVSYMDLAPTNRLGKDILMAVYGPYVLLVDATTGDYSGYFDFSDYLGDEYLIGIAYERSRRSSYSYADYYFLLDTGGNLINAGFLPYQGSYANFVPTVIGNVGYSTDIFYFQSLYYDGTDLYWSRFVEEADKVDIIFVNDINKDGTVYNLGSFEDKVWPIGGLYNSAEKTLIGLNDDSEIDAVLDENTVFAEKITYDPLKAGRPADGGLDSTAESVRTEIDKDEFRSIIIEPPNDNVYSAEIIVEAAKEVLHNGCYEIKYDPEYVTLTGFESDLVHIAYTLDSASGLFRFAFADLEGTEEGGKVFRLMFTANVEEPRTITVKTLEQNDDFEPVEEAYTVQTHTHDWDEPTYDWSEDHSTCTATRVCKDYPDHKETETVATSSSVKEPATCEGMGTTTYTAEFENEAFGTKTIDVADIDPIGHKWGGQPEWHWSDDFTEAYATFTCEHDQDHYKDFDAEVTSASEGSTVTYTAVVELDGVKYEDTRTVEKEEVTVTAYPESALANAYSVQGGILALKYDEACRVGYLTDTGYVELTQHNQAVGEDGITHLFLIPEGVEEIVIVVKGDVTGNGQIDLGDGTRLKAYYRQKLDLDPIALFAADVNGDGAVNLGDATQVTAAFRKKFTIKW
ncbi:MAG: S8 family serine peptidase, partial [Firmicutes bacterium]|nr:S8 family serine peptidase [Bacillota bacterium]